MLLSLKDDHKQHFALLISQPTNVLQDFCRLALDFLRKGPTPKLYQTAAQKLDVQPEIIRNAVEGLVNLLVESCRHQLSELDFRDSVLALGFSEEHQETLELFYKGKKEEICDVLSQLTLDLPHYHDLEWRFEVQPGRGKAVVAVAAYGVLCVQNPLPGLSMECLPHCSWGLFLTASSPSASTVPNWVPLEQLSYILVPIILPEMFSFSFLASRALQHQVTPLITMNLTLETKTALASGSTTKKNIVLQTDPTNLVHITQVLEEALQESRSQHSRRIQRSFK